MFGQMRLEQIIGENGLENIPCTYAYEFVPSSDKYHIDIEYYVVFDDGQIFWLDTKTLSVDQLGYVASELNYDENFNYLSSDDGFVKTR